MLNAINEFQPEFQEKEVDLREYWGVIRRRRWTIITVSLCLLLAAGLWVFTARPMFTAKGTLLIEKEPNILTFEEIFQIESFRDDYYQTQYKLLQSRALALNVVDRLNLGEKEEFGAGRRSGKSPEGDGSARRRELVNAFLSRLEVKPLRMTRLVDISFKSHDPTLAADGVNTLFETFIDMSVEAKYEATEQATAFLSQEITNLRKGITGMEKEMQSYGVEKNIVALSDKETTILEKLGGLNRALTEAQIELSNKKANYEEIKNASPDYLPEALNNPLIQRLREDYVKLSREFTKKQETFYPEYPEMQRLKTELESAKVLLQNETQNLIKGAYSEYQAALKKALSLEDAFNRQKKEAYTLNSNSIVYNSLKIEIQNKQNLLETLLRRQSETGVSARLKGLRTANVRIVDRAEVPVSPSSPKKKQTLFLALFIGLLGGIGLAFLFEHLDNSIKSIEDVDKYAGLPTLGIVPAFSLNGYGPRYGEDRAQKAMRIKILESIDRRVPSGGKGRGVAAPEGGPDGDGGRTIELITSTDPKSNYSECYRSIRTSLLLSGAESSLKSLIVTSPLPAEGKTATVSNLAVTLAQMNKKVVLIDADLRKARLHRIFKTKNLNGLTKYLTGSLEVRDLLRPTEVRNLYLINSGPLPPNPTELLGSERMAALVRTLREEFNFILFDTPPILAVSDAMVLGPVIDGVILIVWGGKTPREALMRAKENLDLLKVKSLGVIINNLNIKQHSYYYKNYYHHYHHYGEQ
jgi:capsular exopolysaccharide synthesis family protein